ncbi:PilW family protein [Dyella tabacisoli]|uniref:Prepilin-type N-terminal cleavage/methylation domain-containing protein n=1 Tax=Dyella tabacisoli TaxID=2282381 RepID=A0A369UHJ7_9GAMM|nr:PilW family protein [Dyella tabacisoli]RDD79957.1 prepilin-type N-terminal cleavage/methylation domain-containing protein [Dyella tabacisoli]
MTHRLLFTRRSTSHQSGVTLIELMIAMVLGLLVAAGIITVFLSTSNSNRAQTQLARLQEEGRFAITRLSEDLRMANGQYCTNSGGTAKLQSAGTYLDRLRAPTVYAKGTNLTAAISDVTTPMDGVSYPAAASSVGSPYTFPSFLSMRGYDCTATACTKVDPNTSVTAIPAMGKAVGSRVVGADVITVRYVNSSRGWAIGSGTVATTNGAASGNTISSIALTQGTGEPPITDFKSGDLAMLADCSNAQIFVADATSAGVITPNASKNYSMPTAQPPQSAPKLFDFNRDFQTVTYYLKVVDMGGGQTTGALIRRVNGNDPKKVGSSEDELVRGIERMDFRYGVQDGNGNISYLTAAQVDAGTNCPPSAPNPLGTDPGCMWRAITSIEISVLMDGQVQLGSLAATDLLYTYNIDKKSTPTAPGNFTINPSDQGFSNQLIRREFVALVSVRNFNP